MNKRRLLSLAACVCAPLFPFADTLPWGWYPGTAFDYASGGAGLEVDGRGSGYYVPADATVRVRNGLGASILETVPGATAVGSVLLKDLLIGIDANDRATISGGLLRVPSGVDLYLGAGPAGTESVISDLVLEAGASTLYAFGAAGATQSLVNVSADIKVLTATGGVLKLAGRIDQPRTFRVSGCTQANTPEVVVGRGAWMANGGWVNIANRIGSANGYGKVRVTDGGRLGPASVNVATTADATYNENGTLIIEKGASVDLNFNRMGLGWNYRGKPRLEVRDGGMLRGFDWLVSWNNHSIMWTDVIFKDGRIQHTSRDKIGFGNGHIGLMGGMHMEVDGGWYSFYEIANSNAGSQIAGQSFWLDLISGFFAIDCGTPNAQNSASCDVWFNLHDGAIFETEKFRCQFPDRYKVKGGLAQLRLDSDGGRLRRKVAGNPAWYYPSAASVDFVPYYCVASIGAKGLAIESDNAISLSAPFYDTSAGSTAKLSLEGRGVKTLTSTNSFEKTLEVAGGKTVFGSKILGTGTAVHSSHAVVTNGAVLSLAGAGTATTLKGLTVSCGALELDADDLFTVDGDVALDTVAVLFTSDFAAGGTRDVFLATNTSVSAAAKAAWANGRLLAGRAADTAYTFTTRTVDGGGTMFAVTATADAGTPKGFTYTAGGKGFAASGTANALARTVSASESWSNLKLPAKVTAEVAAGQTLTVGGTQAGRIVKRGKGKLVLNGKNGFADGLDIDGGVVDVTSAAALGTRGFQAVEMTAGTLQLSDPTPDVFFPMQLVANVTNGYQTVKGTGSYTNVVVLKADSDIRMPFYNAYNGKGTGFIKRGAGTVTFLPRNMAQQGVYIGMSRAHEDKNYYPTTSDVTTFHEDGSVDGYHGLWDVAEGKVVLRDGTYGFMTYNRCCIGLPTTQGTANPELVLDGAGLKNQYDYAFFVGCGFGSANSFATGARLVLTNGAQIGSWVGGLQFGKNSTKVCTNEFVVTDSSVHLNSTIGANLSANVKAVSRFTIRGSLFRSNGFEIYGPIFMDVARSEFQSYGKGSGGTWGSYTPTQLENAFYVCHEAAGNGGSELVFRDKTRLNVGRFQASATYAKPVTVAFDDAIVTNGRSTACAITVQNPKSFRFVIRKGGVTFPVSEGQTLRNVMQLTGEGGLTKTGPGTLVFDSREKDHSGTKDADPLTLCYTGATVVAEGTLVLVNGSVRTGADIVLASGTTLDLSGESWALGTVGGAGTVRNGTLADTCFDLTPTNTTVVPGSLVFGDNLTVIQPSFKLMISDDGRVPGKIDLGTTRFSGRVEVTLVRDEAHPFTKCAALADLEIGSYTGAAPDVSGWRIRGPGARGRAVAADGKIRATLMSASGFVVIIR